MKKIFIVIAAYNEGKSIVNVIQNLKSYKQNNIIVVDDGSRDDTASIASKAGAVVLRHVINRGQGAALKTGIDYAVRNGAEIIVTFDADGQHRVQDLKAMITPVERGECDITLGSRFLGKTKLPWFRAITLKIAIGIVWIFYGMKMTDAHNGFRAMNIKAAKAIDITSDRMEHASQIVEEIKIKKLKYHEIPIVIEYNDYTMQHGHGGFIQGIRVLWTMFVRKILD